jgi:putative DNA primase/helicase
VDELSELGRAALSYAALGLPVLPEHEIDPDGRCTCGCPYPRCWRRAKHPRISNWETGASTDPTEVRRWWLRWPNANIGLGVGQANLVVLDLDLRPGRPDPCELLAHRFGAGAVRTLTSRTGNNGYHLFYRLPPGVVIETRKDILGPGLDVQGRSGLCTLPPSLHPNGRRYTWANGHGPDLCSIATLPGAMAEALQRRPSLLWYAKMTPYWAADRINLSHPTRARLRAVERRLRAIRGI